MLRAVAAVNDTIGPALCGELDAADQSMLDARLRDLDGTANKANLGANAILGVSLAAAHAVANAAGQPLYRYLGGPDAGVVPMPMVNIISGGRHAAAGLDMQDFLVIPIGAETYRRGVADGGGQCTGPWGASCRRLDPTPTVLADEGAYGPPLPCTRTRWLLYDATAWRLPCARTAISPSGWTWRRQSLPGDGGQYTLNLKPHVTSSEAK